MYSTIGYPPLLSVQYINLAGIGWCVQPRHNCCWCWNWCIHGEGWDASPCKSGQLRRARIQRYAHEITMSWNWDYLLSAIRFSMHFIPALKRSQNGTCLITHNNKCWKNKRNGMRFQSLCMHINLITLDVCVQLFYSCISWERLRLFPQSFIVDWHMHFKVTYVYVT